jgi:hypothetical protein
MTDIFARLDAVRDARRRLEQGEPKSLGRSGPIARNGEVQSGWLKTMFGGAGRARAEVSADRSAYLLKCQAVVAAHVIDRSQAAAFPRASGLAEFETMDMAVLAAIGRPLRNTSAPPPAHEVRTVFQRPRQRSGLVANLVNFLR